MWHHAHAAPAFFESSPPAHASFSTAQVDKNPKAHCFYAYRADQGTDAELIKQKKNSSDPLYIRLLSTLYRSTLFWFWSWFLC